MYIGTYYALVMVNASTSIASVIAGSTTTFGSSGDGSAARNAKLGQPGEMAYTTVPSERLYYADQDIKNVRQIDLRTKIITTIAGTNYLAFLQ